MNTLFGIDLGTREHSVVQVWVNEAELAKAPSGTAANIATIPKGATVTYTIGSGPPIRHNGAVKLLEYSYTAGRP